ncbi:MAG: T9SS type A sorting domain-containing protein [Bacteroidota bacterium]|nr:T9SS type A sorting domain-containing protein [Bacteroidota bacterium]
MKYRKIILFISLNISFILAQSQQINQLGIWNNNANFVCKYHQDRLITSTTSGITFLDVSDPSNPIPSSSLGSPSSFPTAIEVNGEYAYFGGGMTGYFMIANISNIDFPVQAGITNNITGTAYQIAIKGDYAFMPTSCDSLYSIDISNKSAPFVTSKISLNDFASGIAIMGDYAFIGTDGGLKVVDISDPLSMSISSSFGGGYGKISADTINNRLFVSKNSTGFDVIDISSPTSPIGLFQGIGGNSIDDLIYKDDFIFQIGPNNVSAFYINSSSSIYLCSFDSAISCQVNAISAKDSIFYLSTVDNVHVLSLKSTNIGIENIKKPTSFIFHPNPANNILIIENKNNFSYTSLSVYNSNGQVVKTANYFALSTYELDISELDKGIYFININSMNSMQQVKFIKE